MPEASYDRSGNLLGTKRTFLDLYTALSALSAGQKTAVWTAITTGSPPLWALTEGQDAGTVAAFSVAAIDLTGLPAAVQTAARLKMVAAYLRDNPTWLVNPAFDPTINVPGFT